jgi:quercetin dioxygenase-like cupin family protein
MLTTVLVVIILGLAHPRSAQDYPDAVTADPDHYSVEFENDAVRLLRIKYGPGETSTMHRHPANCAIFLRDQAGTFELPTGEVMEMPATDYGQMVCTDGEVHLPTNNGDGSLELVLVEFKGAGAPTSGMPSDYPDAVTADPDHYSVEFENDTVRLLRIAYGAGETSTMHRHPANCAVFLTDQPGTFELPTGEVIEMPAADPGQVACTDGEAHLPTNKGDGALELVLIEFKERGASPD